MSEYFDNDKLTELEKDIKTIPIDGEGRTLAVDYDEHFVRNNIIKLIADLRLSREEAAKQKFRFEYTEDLVKKAHAERASLITTIESQKEEIEKAVAESKYQVELTLGFNQMHTDISLQLSDKNAEIESLKAITELAVNQLQQFKDSNVHVKSTLEQIERLQNGSIS